MLSLDNLEYDVVDPEFYARLSCYIVVTEAEVFRPSAVDVDERLFKINGLRLEVFGPGT